MMPAIIKVRPEDADTLTQITVAAKGYWGYPEHWLAHWSGLLTITPAFIATSEVYAARDPAGKLIGWYALVGSGRRLVLDHLWVLPAHIGTGIGRALFTHAVKRAAELGAEEVELEADPHAAGFYERMGARRIGERRVAMDGLERHLPLFVVEVARLGPTTRQTV